MATQAPLVASPTNMTISLQPERRMWIVGANEAGIGRFRIGGEDRYEFANLGTIKQLKDMPGKNFDYVIMNGKIGPDFQQQAATLADRGGAMAVIITEDGGCLVRMMEGFPFKVRGIATFQVPGVTKVINFHSDSVLKPDREVLGGASPSRTNSAAPSDSKHPVPEKLHVPFAGSEELLEAIEAAKLAQEKVVECAGKVAAENQRLAQMVEQKETRIEELEGQLLEESSTTDKAIEFLQGLKSHQKK